MIDLQKTAYKNNIYINKVGIQDLTLPILVNVSKDYNCNSIAKFDMAIGLEGNKRGTHMSRFCEILESKTWNIDLSATLELLSLMQHKLDCAEAFLTIKTKVFIPKTAPKSKSTGLLDYAVTYKAQVKKNQSQTNLEVSVPVTSLCPCSKAISEYGAHNQRSIININVTTTDNIFPETLIKLAEKHASCELFSILKRDDEKHVTEAAYENAKFVEDTVRDIAAELNSWPSILDYKIESINYESIHNHQAYAVITKF